MKELSLNILDIAMNSVKAGAKIIAITLEEDDERLGIVIEDDGCGMTKEQVERLSDPFFTTRTTRKVGLGVPFYKLAAEQTGGYLEIESVPVSEDNHKHGTKVTAVFNKKHIDATPLGDIVSTMITLIQGNPDIDYLYTHIINGKAITLSTTEMRSELGDVPLSDVEVLCWIKEYLTEQYESIS
jgi:hypothetical protein